MGKRRTEQRAHCGAAAAAATARMSGCCAACGDGLADVPCPHCRAEAYCNEACLAAAWKAGHKSQCVKMRDELQRERRSRRSAGVRHAMDIDDDEAGGMPDLLMHKCVSTQTDSVITKGCESALTHN